MPDDDLKRFGANLKAVRNERGVSQMELSRNLNLHVTSIARLETGNRNPSVKTVIKLARGLGVPAADLLRGL